MRTTGNHLSYIVGIGASVGGLEAFEDFFKSRPPDSGTDLVVIQHLDPTHKGILPELHLCHPTIGPKKMLLNARRLKREAGGTPLILLQSRRRDLEKRA